MGMETNEWLKENFIAIIMRTLVFAFTAKHLLNFPIQLVNIKLVQMISFQWMFVKLGLRQNVVFKIQIVTMNENFVLYNAGLILTEKLIYKMTDG